MLLVSMGPIQCIISCYVGMRTAYAYEIQNSYITQGSIHTGRWWLVSTATQPCFTTTLAILTTSHYRVNVGNVTQNAL